MNQIIPTLAVAAAALFSKGIGAQSFFEAIPTETTTEELDLDSPWTHRAWVQQKTGYGWHAPSLPASRDKAALTRTETHLFGEIAWRKNAWRLQASGSIVQGWLPDLEDAGVYSRYTFTTEQHQQRRWHLEMADTFVSWQNDDWWIKAGYQTLAWGESESLKVTDVLARRDQRWPGQEDLEKLRLPVPAVQITWGKQLDLVTIINPLPDRMPAAGDEFDPYADLGQQQPNIAIVEHSDNRPGVALRYRQQWQGLDTQWILADVASYETELETVSAGEKGPVAYVAPWRQQVAGASAQWVSGSWLVRTEQALHFNTKVASADPVAPWQDTRQWRGMLGADYNGINDLVLTAEYSWLYVDNWHSGLAGERYQPAASGRASYTLLNEQLTLEAYAQAVTGGEGSVMRLMVEWQFSDRFSAAVTAIEYNGDHPEDLLYPYRHNDTLLLNLRWGL
ncbi:hypothetical protein QWI17_12125 [Gilvimarinus sp. SDUM040013]|uniref:DUF1302 family protein n=1 Tax=Gilvimarinus gilvus TaxID=3058038 RepID=A0ABU4RWA6_9GAMM|nr:DUF1302 family protein [Gilvimarinus sp. SDUM040013]MDO3386584.1 hypothetical protein [Gilvimarinus sp. SDUM040013]MDX6849160.1 DUF1302 family protein [Gilvimarinus sp. SDUM040013]